MWFKQIITGSDNETVAIGRVLGIAVALVFLFTIPVVGCILLVKAIITADLWATVIDKLPIYITAVAFSVAGLVGLTAMSEPKAPKE